MTEQDGTEPDIHSIQGHKEKVPMERADNIRACHERNHLCCSSTNEDHFNMIENFKLVFFYELVFAFASRKSFSVRVFFIAEVNDCLSVSLFVLYTAMEGIL